MSEDKTIKNVEELLKMQLSDQDKLDFISGVVNKTISMDPGVIITNIGPNHYQAKRGDLYEQFLLIDGKKVYHGMNYRLLTHAWIKAYYDKGVHHRREEFDINNRRLYVYHNSSSTTTHIYEFSKVQSASDPVVTPDNTLEQFQYWLNKRITEVKTNHIELGVFRRVYLPDFGNSRDDYKKHLPWLEKFAEHSGYKLTGNPHVLLW
jgi:hypothetical protein